MSSKHFAEKCLSESHPPLVGKRQSSQKCSFSKKVHPKNFLEGVRSRWSFFAVVKTYHICTTLIFRGGLNPIGVRDIVLGADPPDFAFLTAFIFGASLLDNRNGCIGQIYCCDNTPPVLSSRIKNGIRNQWGIEGAAAKKCSIARTDKSQAKTSVPNISETSSRCPCQKNIFS